VGTDFLGGLQKATDIANQFNISTSGVSNMA
jgi:hypothetical protein